MSPSIRDTGMEKGFSPFYSRDVTLSEKNKVAKCENDEGIATVIDKVNIDAIEEYEFTLLEGT